jgi:NADH-quinone oxidoreductase subunit H
MSPFFASAFFTDALPALLHLCLFPGGLFALAFGLILKGVDRRAEARLQRRIGPPLRQPWYDLAKLFTKTQIIPCAAHRIAFLAAPVIALAGVLTCAALLPVPGVTSGLSDMGDLLVILYLLPLSGIALMLGGSASGSPYGAVGLSREMSLMLAYELPLSAIFLAVALKAGTATGGIAEFSLRVIVSHQSVFGQIGFDPTMIPALLAWLFVVPATLGIAPFDLAEAETEILEGPLLEYSGPALAFFQMASAVKLFLVLGLGVTLFFPGTLPGGPFVNLIWFMAKCLLGMLLAVTLVRAAHGRLRTDQALRLFTRVPTALACLSLALAWLGL